jgi:hypothetical protein
VRRVQLTGRQRALLQRVADGDDLADVPAGDKRSTSALHDRGMVVVRRSPWRAAITDAGQFYLKHGRYSDNARREAAAQVEQQAGITESSPQPATSVSPARSSPKRPPSHTTARISAERRTVAVELVDELVAAGEKVIKNPDEAVQTH